MVASATVLSGAAGSYWTVPDTLVKAPRTVEIPICRTENCAAVWFGSMFQVSTSAEARVDAQSAMLRTARKIRMMFETAKTKGVGYAVTGADRKSSLFAGCSPAARLF
jgi:hypothetical protein